jgi:hypothetical protein
VIFYRAKRRVFILQPQQMAPNIITEAEYMVWPELLWAANSALRFLVKLNMIINDVMFIRHVTSFVTRDDNGLSGGLA